MHEKQILGPLEPPLGHLSFKIYIPFLFVCWKLYL